MSSSSSDSSSASSPPPTSSTPRKRKIEVEHEDELEIDLAAPEPLSKKELRKVKKSKTSSTATSGAEKAIADGVDDDAAKPATEDAKKPRSAYAVWIGNLPWSCTKADVRAFFVKDTIITDTDITRVHMPQPAGAGKEGGRTLNKPKNKGFAYVDFATVEQRDAAIALSDTLLLGRRVLIKDATSFEGRPEPAKDGDAAAVKGKSDKPPSKRIFIGNLGFDVTSEDLQSHFGQCGEVALIHVATFEDSGKCKGYAWVTFEDVESATAAVRGWVSDQAADGADEDDERAKSSKKKARVYVNKLNGRPLRCEFAEDKTVRYQKRYGKGSRPDRDFGDSNGPHAAVAPVQEAGAASNDKTTAHDRRRERRQKQRETGDGGQRKQRYQAPASDARPSKATGAIAAGAGGGKKTTFD